MSSSRETLCQMDSSEGGGREDPVNLARKLYFIKALSNVTETENISFQSLVDGHFFTCSIKIDHFRLYW